MVVTLGWQCGGDTGLDNVYTCVDTPQVRKGVGAGAGDGAGDGVGLVGNYLPRLLNDHMVDGFILFVKMCCM